MGPWIPKDLCSNSCTATNQVCDCRQMTLLPLLPGLRHPLGKSGLKTVTLQG